MNVEDILKTLQDTNVILERIATALEGKPLDKYHKHIKNCDRCGTITTTENGVCLLCQEKERVQKEAVIRSYEQATQQPIDPRMEDALKAPHHNVFWTDINAFIFYKVFQREPTINEHGYIRGSACPNGCKDNWKNIERPQQLRASGHWRKDERPLEEKGYPKDCYCPKCWKKNKDNYNIEWRV